MSQSRRQRRCLIRYVFIVHKFTYWLIQLYLACETNRNIPFGNTSRVGITLSGRRVTACLTLSMTMWMLYNPQPCLVDSKDPSRPSCRSRMLLRSSRPLPLLTSAMELWSTLLAILLSRLIASNSCTTRPTSKLKAMDLLVSLATSNNLYGFLSKSS